MPTFLFFLLIVVPVVEIASIVFMASLVGGALTFVLIVMAAVLGFLVMRYAGRSWWASLRASAGAPDASGVATPPRLPDAKQAADRGLLFLGGLLIAFPGFVGDVVGLLLLLPFVRSGLRVVAAAWFVGRFTAVTAPGGFVVWRQEGLDAQPGRGPTTVTVEQVVPGEVIRAELMPKPADPDPRAAPPPESRGG